MEKDNSVTSGLRMYTYTLTHEQTHTHVHTGTHSEHTHTCMYTHSVFKFTADIN